MFHAAPSDGQLQPVADAEPRQVGQRGARLGARAPLSTACRRPLLGAIGALSIWVRAQVVAVGRCGLQTTIAPREDWSRPQQTSTRAMLWHPAQRLFPPKPTGTRIIVGAAGAWLYASGLRGSSFPTYAWSPCGFAGSVAAPARLHERWSAPVGRLLRRSLRRSRPRAHDQRGPPPASCGGVGQARGPALPDTPQERRALWPAPGYRARWATLGPVRTG
jgi:hypothetical protein